MPKQVICEHMNKPILTCEVRDNFVATRRQSSVRDMRRNLVGIVRAEQICVHGICFLCRYDNFRKRAYVSKTQKLLTLPSSWWKRYVGAHHEADSCICTENQENVPTMRLYSSVHFAFMDRSSAFMSFSHRL